MGLVVQVGMLLLIPLKAFAVGEAIAVSPLLGPVGRTVTVIGTGWQDLGSRGIDVPIWIGFANQVADGHPDANGNFSVSFTIPLTLPPPPDFRVLRCLVWVETCSCGEPQVELSSEQVDHGFEVSG